LLTGYVSGFGTVAGTDTVLQAIQKLNGNDALKAVDSNVLHQTGFASENKTGTLTVSSGSSPITWTLKANNLGSATAALEVQNVSGTNTLIQAKDLSSNIVFSVSGAGDVTGNSFIKTGGTADQILLANGTVGIRPKIYNALITQSSTGAPIVTVLGNNTIGTIVWTRTTTGSYVGTLTGAFTASKTMCFINNTVVGSNTFQQATANTVTLTTADSTGTLLDGRLTANSIKIEVYP